MLTTVETTKTTSFFTKQNEDLFYLRWMLSTLLENMSAADVTESQRVKCKSGIKALQAAIDAIETISYA